MTEQEKQEILKALTRYADWRFRYEPCPLANEPTRACYELRQKADELTKYMSAELEQVKQERDAWKRRAEAAERDITSMLESCDCEMRHEYCARCYPPNQCNTDECTGYAKWRGPCAENGGAENGL